MKTLLDKFPDDAATDEVATVSNKALTTNVATLTTAAAHGLTAGDRVVVAGVGSPFDGTFAVASAPTTTTFTYAKTNANVTSAAATGTVSKVAAYALLGVPGGRSGRKIILQNLGPGTVSYDFSEPTVPDDIADVGFTLAVNASVTLDASGDVYVSTTADDTDIRYAAS